MKTAQRIAELVVDFINVNAAPEGRIHSLFRETWVERLAFAISENLHRVDEAMLREHDGSIHVGNGCEIAIRGMSERLAYLDKFPCHFTAEELAKHNAAIEELRTLHAAHAALIQQHDRLKVQLEAFRECARLRKELSQL